MNKIFKRYEFKYPVPDHIVPSLQTLLLHYGMKPDPHVAGSEHLSYTVSSLYFDSPTLSDYNDKAGGFLSRKKIRVRIYEPRLTERTKEIWLEKKAKHDMFVAKKRMLLPFGMYRLFLGGSHTTFLQQCRDDANGYEIFSHIVREQMKPRLITRYQRVPLFAPGPADVRITLDSHIEACFSNDLCYALPMKMVRPGTAVMEIKFGTILPSWFKGIVQRFELARTSFSKYANALETLRVYNPIPR